MLFSFFPFYQKVQKKTIYSFTVNDLFTANIQFISFCFHNLVTHGKYHPHIHSILKIIKHIFRCLLIFPGEKQILYKLVLVFFCFSCYNGFIIHIFLSYLKSHHLHFGNFPFLKILWIVPVFEASLLLS